MSQSTPSMPVRNPRLIARLSAEALGTFFIMLAGVGVAMVTNTQVTAVPAPLAAGLAVAASMLAFGYLSGGHFNPAITLGNLIVGRIRPLEAAAYVVAQLVGGLAGGLVLFGIVRTSPRIEDSRTAFDPWTAGFGEHSPAQVPLAGVLLLEVIGVALLVGVFLAATSRRNSGRAMAPFAVGLTFAVLLQLGQSIGNAPFNPARATATAIFSSAWAVEQLWLFWVAPLAGAAIAGLVVRGFMDPGEATTAGPAESAAEDLDTQGPRDAVYRDHRLAGNGSLGTAGDAGPEKTRPAGGSAGSITDAGKGDDGDEARDFFDGKRD